MHRTHSSSQTVTATVEFITFILSVAYQQLRQAFPLGLWSWYEAEFIWVVVYGVEMRREPENDVVTCAPNPNPLVCDDHGVYQGTSSSRQSSVLLSAR